MNAIAKECGRLLQAWYGPRLAGVVVYGSQARGSATPESDLDLLVLLRDPFDYFEELRRIIDILYPVQLRSDQLVSAKPASVEEYERGTLQLYRNARQEGVAIA